MSAFCSQLKQMSEVSCHLVSVLMQTSLISFKCFHPNLLKDFLWYSYCYKFPVAFVLFCIFFSSVLTCHLAWNNGVGEVIILFVPIIILLIAIAFLGLAAYFVNTISILNSLHVENSISAFVGNSIPEAILQNALHCFNRLSSCSLRIAKQSYFRKRRNFCWKFKEKYKASKRRRE